MGHKGEKKELSVCLANGNTKEQFYQGNSVQDAQQ